MKYYKSKDYMRKNVPMVDRSNPDISTKEKRTDGYYLQVIEGFYTEYVRGRGAFSISDANSLEENRRYLNGKQDEAQYIRRFYGETEQKDNDSSKVRAEKVLLQKAIGDIDSKIVSPAPRLADVVGGKLSRGVHRISVDPTDKYSGALKENIKWGKFVESKHRKDFKFFDAMAGVQSEEPEYVPTNVEELNLYDAEGGFKLSYAIAMEQLVKHSHEISGWEHNIETRVISDLVAGGYAVVRDIICPDTGKAKCEYVDPIACGVQYTRTDSYERPDWAFFLKNEKLSNVRRDANLSDEKCRAMVDEFSVYSADLGFAFSDDWSQDTKDTTSRYGSQYDQGVVPILEVFWIDFEHDKMAEYVTSRGKLRSFAYDPKKHKGDKYSIKGRRVKMLYTGKWVVGSDIVYGCGPVKHQARKGMSEPIIPIVAVKVPHTPLIDRIRPILDNYQMAWIRFQHRLNTAIPDGVSIDLSAISNLNIGSKPVTALEVLKLHRTTGYLFRKDKSTIANNVSNPNAIIPIQGNLQSVIDTAIQELTFSMNEIIQETGLSATALGSDPAERQGKAVTELALQGTSDVLENILAPLNRLKAKVSENMCFRIQEIVKDSERALKAYEDIIGKTRCELLRIAEGHQASYGITTKARPTEAEIQSLEEAIDLSLQNGRDGGAGIGIEERVRFKQMISEGQSLKRIAMMFGFADKKARDQASERASEAQKITQQGEAQARQDNLQMNIALERAKAIASVELEKQKSRGQIISSAYSEGKIQNYKVAISLLDNEDHEPVDQKQANMGGLPNATNPQEQGRTPIQPMGEDGAF